jgi:hypothetical protein
MMSIRTLLISLSLALISLPAGGAPQPRPFTGLGVVVIRPFIPERAAELAAIPLYREPGVGRIAERAAGAIPGLSPVLNLPAGTYPVAVMGKKGNWLRIAIDDAGREGWVEMARWWEYLPWDDFLKGRIARLLPGLKKGEYALRSEPGETAPQSATLSGRENLRLIEVRDDWALAVAAPAVTGWLRWRDGDGRFQISLDGLPPLQNH